MLLVGIIRLYMYYDAWCKKHNDNKSNVPTYNSKEFFVKYAYWKHEYTCLNCICISTNDRSGYLSRYNDTPRAGQSGNRMPVGARFFAPFLSRPGPHPASCTMGTRSFSVVKPPERGVDHTPSSSVEVNPLKTKLGLLYLKTQFVPRSKHFSSRL